MTLPTYKADTVCPQCAHDVIGTHFLDGNEYACMSTYAPKSATGGGASCHYVSGPHHHRDCRRCGFRWAEAANAPSMSIRASGGPGPERGKGPDHG